MGSREFNVDENDDHFMRLAVAEAKHAAAKGEVPVGAVIVRRGEIIGRGHNQREALKSPVAHAEILSIEKASTRLGSWRLSECDLYVTLEPCVMCAGAIIQARLERLIFGCLDLKGGGVQSLYRLCDDARMNHRLPVAGGVLEVECARLLERFFYRLREQKRSEKHAERWPSPVEGA